MTTPLGHLKNLDFSEFCRHLEFCWKWKISFISKTVRDTALSGKCWTLRVLTTTPLAPLRNLDFFDFLVPILNFGRNGECHLSRKP